MYEVPISVTVDDKIYPIRKKGDFRVILDCFQAMNDIELEDYARTLASFMIFYEDFNSPADILKLSKETLEALSKEMSNFINCGITESPSSNHLILVDWDKDSQLICSAINNVAGKEIRLEPYVHWWTFMGYYMSIGESVMAQVVAIRQKILQGKKLEKHERQFQASNPQFFDWNHQTIQEREEDEYIKNLWNNG